jgi:hypothetical protein
MRAREDPGNVMIGREKGGEEDTFTSQTLAYQHPDKSSHCSAHYTSSDQKLTYICKFKIGFIAMGQAEKT